MINYWQQWNERERLMVVIATLCVLIYGFYLGIYAPLTNAVTAKTKQLTEKQETLHWMQRAAQQARPKKAPQSISNSKLLSIIATELGTNHLKPFPYQMQQTASGDIQLSFEQVPYTAALQWLWSLNENYQLKLKQLRIDKSDTAGVVKLAVVLAAE